MDESRNRKHPLDFRKDETNYIMQRWRAAESCSLVGVGSVGKSNLLQHLTSSQVQQTHINMSEPDMFKTIIIDPNMLGPFPVEGNDNEAIRCWAGYELMMHRLFLAFYPFEVLGQEDAQNFYETYQALQDGTNPLYAYMGLRYFELGLDFFFRKGVRIVFMFDEFETLLKYMPVRFFRQLRGLRDANKRQLSYLTFTRTPISNLLERYNIPEQDIEPFTELFIDNVLYIGPYSDIDARRMIDTLMTRNQKAYPDQAVQFLMWATGNYAGLIRSGLRLLDALGPLDAASMMNDETLHQFAIRRPIRTECRSVWRSLTEDEQRVLKAIAGLTPYDIDTRTEQGVAMLVQKRLLRIDKERNSLHIEPPVFREFVKHYVGQES